MGPFEYLAQGYGPQDLLMAGFRPQDIVAAIQAIRMQSFQGDASDSPMDRFRDRQYAANSMNDYMSDPLTILMSGQFDPSMLVPAQPSFDYGGMPSTPNLYMGQTTSDPAVQDLYGAVQEGASLPQIIQQITDPDGDGVAVELDPYRQSLVDMAQGMVEERAALAQYQPEVVQPELNPLQEVLQEYGLPSPLETYTAETLPGIGQQFLAQKQQKVARRTNQARKYQKRVVDDRNDAYTRYALGVGVAKAEDDIGREMQRRDVAKRNELNAAEKVADFGGDVLQSGENALRWFGNKFVNPVVDRVFGTNTTAVGAPDDDDMSELQRRLAAAQAQRTQGLAYRPPRQTEQQGPRPYQGGYGGMNWDNDPVYQQRFAPRIADAEKAFRRQMKIQELAAQMATQMGRTPFWDTVAARQGYGWSSVDR